MNARALAAALLAPLLAGQERPFHFAHDVQPWLLRQGCAAADCHGGATGRGGLKLSLFGADPDADWRSLAVERDARRIDLRDAERSLVLRKPSGALEHGGGVRLARGGAAWRALRDWIAAGAPFGSEAAPQVTALELRVDGDRARAIATFAWTDAGSGAVVRAAEDVTARAWFTASAPDVVDVEPSGRVLRHGAGDAWLFARFAGHDARVRLVAPFAGPPAAPRPAAGALDAAWRAGLAELGLAPGARAADQTLLRRLHLDLVGRLPTPAERRAFLDAPAATRVAATVDALLESPDFAAVAGGWLADWFELPAGAPLRGELDALAARDTSLLDAVAARVDRPLIERLPDPRDRAELFGRAVLGVRIGCARCHDHPHDRWTRDDHLGFAALFVDARPAADAGMTAGALFDPQTGARATPRLPSLLGGGDGDVASALRAHPDAFARNVANRVFAALIGRGLVEPVDDHRPTNPAVHPALLDALAAAFAGGGHRLRPLVRAIATSELYARTTAPADDALDAAQARYLARRTARPLPEATLRRAVATALAVGRATPEPDAASPLSLWLSLWNGTALRADLDAPGSALELIRLACDDDDAALTELFHLLLTRDPTSAERERLTPLLGAPDGLPALAHAIVLSREFTSIR